MLLNPLELYNIKEPTGPNTDVARIAALSRHNFVTPRPILLILVLLEDMSYNLNNIDFIYK